MNEAEVLTNCARAHAAYLANETGWQVTPVFSASKPLPRSGHSVAAHDGKLWVFGGYNTSSSLGECYDTLWGFDTSSLKWVNVPKSNPWPRARCGHSVIVVGDSLVMWGGTSADFGSTIFSELWLFDLKTLRFSLMPRSDGRSADNSVPFGAIHQQVPIVQPPSTYGQSLVLGNETHALLFGGTDGRQYTNAVYSLNLKTFLWTRLECSGAVPSARYMSNCFVRKGQLVVFGGGKHIPTGLDPIEIYTLDLSKLVWSTISLPKDETTPRCLLGSAMVRLTDDDFLLYGGRCQGQRGEGSVKQSESTWMFSFARGLWTRCVDRSVPSARDYLAGALVDGRVFLFGGFDGTSRLDEIVTRRVNFEPAALELMALQNLCRSVSEDDEELAALPEVVKHWIVNTSPFSMRVRV